MGFKAAVARLPFAEEVKSVVGHGGWTDHKLIHEQGCDESALYVKQTDGFPLLQANTLASRWHCCVPMPLSFNAGEPGALYVEEADGSAVALVTSTEQLESIMAGMNRKGLRERGLLAALRRKHTHIAAALDPESASLDLKSVSR